MPGGHFTEAKMPIVIRKAAKPVKIDPIVEEEKPQKLWVPRPVEQISTREPLEAAIKIARTLARQAARRDHAAELARLASTNA
jgi:hypothetical protein